MKLEHVILTAAVTTALAVPFASFGRLSSGRFVPVDSDEAHLVLPPRSEATPTNEPTDAVDVPGLTETSETSETSDSEHGWMFLTRRTLSRLIWLAAENFIVTRELGRWHAERTGQVESYEAFVASARTNIRESWNGIITAFETLPRQVTEDPSQLPMLAGALVVGAIGGVLYPIQSASTLVFGSDEEAGEIAGGFIIDAWTAKALAAAGLGTRALKAQRVARVWSRFLQKGDELAAAFFPRSRTLAHAPTSTPVLTRGPLHARAPAIDPHKPLAMSTGSDRGGAGSIDPAHIETRAYLEALGLQPWTADGAARSPTIREAAANLREQRILRDGDLSPQATYWPRWDGMLLPYGRPEIESFRGDRNPELMSIARFAAMGTALRNPGSHVSLHQIFVERPGNPAAGSFEYYLRRNEVSLVRLWGEATVGRIQVRNELRELFPNRRREIDLAFDIDPTTERVYQDYLKHGDRQLLVDELGIERIADGDNFMRHAHNLHTLHREESSALDAKPEQFPEFHREATEGTINRLLERLAIAEHARETHVPPPFDRDPVDAELARRTLLQVVGDLRGSSSPTLLDEITQLHSMGWRFAWSENPTLDLPQRYSHPGQILVYGDGYRRLAVLARKVGTAMEQRDEVLWDPLLRRMDYVDPNVLEAMRVEGAGVLRAFEIRDELMRSLPDDAAAIRTAFGELGPAAEEIYQRYLATAGAQGVPDLRDMQMRLGRLVMDNEWQTRTFDVEARLKAYYVARYDERLFGFTEWGW